MEQSEQTLAARLSAACPADPVLKVTAGLKALRGALAELARRTSELVNRGAPLIPQIRDMRLGAEIAAIHALARRLSRDLESRDPLSERVHLGKAGFALVGGLGAARFLGSAMMRSVGVRAKATA